MTVSKTENKMLSKIHNQLKLNYNVGENLTQEHANNNYLICHRLFEKFLKISIQLFTTNPTFRKNETLTGQFYAGKLLSATT